VNEVIRAAAELQAFCEEWRWRHCIIGGLAVQRWGEVRVLLLTSRAGVGLDVALGGLPFEELAIVRAQLAPLVELKEAPEI
jgi:hypothetical protein